MPGSYEHHSPDTTPSRTPEDLIVGAGAKNFYAQGYINTDVSDICIDAEISHNTFSEHFLTMELIGHAVIETSFAGITSTSAFHESGAGFANKLYALQEAVDLFPGVGVSLLYSEPGQPPAQSEKLLPAVYQELLASAKTEKLEEIGLTAESIVQQAMAVVVIPPIFGEQLSRRTSLFLNGIASDQD